MSPGARTVQLEPAQDPALLRRAFARFPSGVGAVCALVDGEPVGLCASSFTSVSLDPPMVLVCFAHTSTTWPVLRRASAVGLSILGGGQAELCRTLSARGADRFGGVEWTATASGAVLLSGASLWLSARRAEELRAGDHDVVVFTVDSLATFDAAPLVFHDSRLRALPA